ncbi:glycoside hydrolase family 70 protein [Leuconostoc suionicum]|uniref:glycoside hydrolase family 70 protein n=1 Tax=Leuconostoc suionicum TaxID=1511761 RepID=UPI0024AE5B28|nr:glycoside hydrolase family 70 protein [Leuconostoc suionicum]MDI6498677.1 glycoside hydrolase family 70 protein [Leuconostoc suionicum]MDI6500719.1 glycoside hydrolase family 70 protein [Leuconostoc suionicum]MDI6502843.1 glycoside hydrolase family 70 protein [Leuconostoc suionicum]MDI6614805.1 glycoside hydrolase family 70 protein [Leuconostoc suionicum]MDI6665702.1 glycoside hydrolase family 70 protein [Leuconostoc suionicum]
MRKRMYKAGKSWVVAAAAFATAAMVSGGNASANDVTQQNTATVQTATANTDTTKNVTDTTTQDTTKNVTDTTTQDTTKNVTGTTTQDTTSNTVTADNTVNNVATTTDNVVKNQYKENSNGSWSYYDNNGQIVKGLQTINGNIQYFDPTTGEQVKGQTLTIDGVIYSFDRDSGNGTKTEVASLPTTGSYATKDGSNWQYEDQQQQPIKGLYTDKDNLRYFNETDGTQAKGTVVSVDNNTYYFDKDSGNGQLIPSVTGGQYGTIQLNNQTVWVYRNANGEIVKGLQNINGNIQYFDPTTGEQLKGKTATINGVTYYFEASDGNLVGTVDNGLVNVNGQIQYFDPTTGEQAKNKQVTVNDVTYYFDDNGNGQYVFTNAVSSTTPDAYSAHTQAYNTDQSSFTNVVDGFLTADSWYRPKEVISDATGSTWKTSSENDYRPIITVWWPNKNVEVNYLKLMQDNDLLSTQTQFTIFSDQYTLNEAAQAAQNEIEKRIYREKSTDWLKDLLFEAHGDTPSFVKQQFIWNKDSEYPYANSENEWYQGGYLSYEKNSDLTPNADSHYRNADNMFDYLLANDVDSSNPVVQAENLNWLHYLMNFGSITADDSNANFDGIRVDAVDFVSNDTNQRTYDYLRDAYQVDQSNQKANAHLSLVEATLEAGTSWVNSDALIESNMRDISNLVLTNAPGKNASLKYMINDTGYKKVNDSIIAADAIDVANRSNDYTENVAIPNYSIIHAHDKGTQEIIGQVIKKTTGQDVGGDINNFTAEQLKEGLKAYYEDQRKPIKEYNSYNMPSIYALMLTNKDTVPRVYYGDLYQDDGQYMEKTSVYYDAITALMKNRVKYVSGGQNMSVDDNGVLTSVRFGKNALKPTDTGDSETRTSGIGVIVANNPSLDLKGKDVVLSMGAAHANQTYRAALLSTNTGIIAYDSDDGAPTAKTNDKGELIFSANEIDNQANTNIRGVGADNNQVSGYLAVWVPVGASDNQDVRTDASTTETTDGKVFHSDAALDSNLIYEGFSSFQPQPTTNSELTNVIIAQPQNIQKFHDWGITSFEMAPQYRSSQDGTFLDSVIDNGYAFSDRYDLGFNTPTKYGTDEDLRNAIKALHGSGMQVMADVVYNQLYNLQSPEIVTASRVNMYNSKDDVPFGTQLYVANTIGGGKYQEEYGGEFLKELYNKYPDLFNSKSYEYWNKNYGSGQDKNTYTLSSRTRPAIDTNTKITRWSAKYLNGTSLPGRGMGYVLKDWNTGTYFKLDGNNTILPTELEIKSHWVANTDGTYSYYDKNAHSLLVGSHVIDGQTVYFDEKGIQAKGKWAQSADGTWAYYDAKNGDRIIGDQYIDDHYIRAQDHSVNATGYLLDVVTDQWAWYENGQKYTGFRHYMGAYYYFKNGVRQENSFETAWGNTYYVGNDGRTVQGEQVIDGQLYDFGTNGTFNLKSRPSGYLNKDNGWKWYENGQKYTGFRYYMGAYYYFKDGVRQENSFETAWGKTYYVGSDGRTVQGIQTINGKQYYFGNDNTFYLRTNTIQKVGNQTFKSNDNGVLEPWIGYIYDGSADNGGYRWYENGQLFTGFRYYMGYYYWFENGVRSGAGWHGVGGYMYYTDQNGHAVQGIQHIPDVDGIYHGNGYYDFGNDGTYYLRSAN